MEFLWGWELLNKFIMKNHSIVRLLAKVNGSYCSLDAGEIVKLQVNNGLCYLERQTWVNPKVQLMNSLCGVPEKYVSWEELQITSIP